MIRLIQYIILIILPFHVAGQINIQFDRITTKEGLSQNTVRSILKDQYGFIWFGTHDGLNLYDGISMRVYNHDIYNENSLSNSSINHISEDSNGDLWISTINGLTRFDRITETFHRYLIPGFADGSYIYCTMEDSRGTLWVGTIEGIYYLNKEKDILMPYKFHASLREKQQLQVKKLYEDRMGNILFGTLTQGIFVYHPLDTSALTLNTSTNPALNHNQVEDIMEDSAGNIWIGTYGGGVNVWKRLANSISYITKDMENGLSDNLVRVVMEDIDKNIWIGTFDGLNKFDTQSGEMQRIISGETRLGGFDNNSIRSILQDSTGIIWIGTFYGGVYVYNSLNYRFKQYAYTPDFDNSDKDKVVNALLEDKDLNLWVGTEKGGLNFYNKVTKQLFFYTPDDESEDGSSVFTIKALLLEDNNKLWVGTLWQGLYLFNIKEKKFSRIFKNNTLASDLNNSIISYIHKDHNGFLWLCSGNNGGLFKFDPDKQELITFRMQAEVQSLIGNVLVMSIYQDSFGNMWLGTRGNGIIVFNEETGYCEQFMHDANNQNSLLNNHVFYVMQDKDADIWVVTYGAGVGKFDRITKGFDFTISTNGLLHNKAFGILEDSKGMLWIITNKGLSRFDKNDSIFINYDMGAGLPLSELNIGAFHKGKYSGKLYFGGIDGFFEIDPEKFTNNYFIPPVLIRGFRLLFKNDKVIKKSHLLGPDL